MWVRSVITHIEGGKCRKLDICFLQPMLQEPYQMVRVVGTSLPSPLLSSEKFRHSEYELRHSKYGGIGSDTQRISSDAQSTMV